MGKHLVELIEEGTDRNILVYDSDAHRGRITKRLLCLLPLTFERNYGHYPNKIYIPELSREDMFFVLFDNLFAVPTIPEKVLGMEIEWVTGLDGTQREYNKYSRKGEMSADSVYLTYYEKELGGATAYDDENLLVVTSDTDVMLGSF